MSIIGTRKGSGYY